MDIFIRTREQGQSSLTLAKEATMHDLRSAITEQYGIGEGQYHQLFLGGAALEQEDNASIADTGICPEAELELKVTTVFSAAEVEKLQEMEKILQREHGSMYYKKKAWYSEQELSILVSLSYNNCVHRITKIFANTITAEIFWQYWLTQLTKEEGLCKTEINLSQFSQVFSRRILEPVTGVHDLRILMDGINLAESLKTKVDYPVEAEFIEQMGSADFLRELINVMDYCRAIEH